jgi:HlyD family secretion protein
VGGWFGWQALPQNVDGGPRYITEPATIEAEIAERTTATGTLQPLVAVNVGAQVSGRIAKLHADFNQVVGEGALLAEIDPTLVLAQIAQGRAGLAAAEANVARAESVVRNAARVQRRVLPLHVQGLATRAELETAQGAVELAQADLRATKAQVAQARARDILV